MPSFMDKLKKGMNVKKISLEEEPLVMEENDEDVKKNTPKEELEEAEAPTNDEPLEEDEEELSETEEKQADEEEKNPTGPEEITVEEMEQRFKENKPGGIADNASTRNLISRMIVEEEPIHKKKKKTQKTHHTSLKEEISHKIKTVEAKRKEWFQSNGELVVDVYESDGYMIIKSAIAGVKPEDLDISIENDTVCIKGSRKETTTEKDRNYFHQECYWGEFSREIILPVEVDGGKTEASMKNGILTITVPKIEHEKKKISIK